MEKIDRRRHYILVFDTETANSLDDPLVYDIGWAIVDKHGNVYETKSFVNDDIFTKEYELMKTAYYSDKRPIYWKRIMNGETVRKSWYEIRIEFLASIEKWGIKEVVAHNSRFDYRATTTTQRWLTKSKYRYFIPKDIEIWDTLKMARDVLSKMPTYIEFCETNGYMTKHRTPQPQLTAEVIYRYITNDTEFVESHTGLEDVEIETEIFKYCMRQHKPMRKKLFEEN
jgi:hypothetical protein